MKRRTVYLLLIGISILTILLYLPSMSGDFVFDDIHITDKQYLRGFTKYFDLATWFNFYGRPLAFLTIDINYFFSGLDTTWYHIVNLVVHLLNTYLIFMILKSIFKDKLTKKSYFWFTIISLTLLFAIHPLQTQAVSYVIQRMTSMMSFFYLLSFYFYLKWRTSGKKGIKKSFFYMFVISICLVLSFLNKQNAVTFVFPVFFWELIYGRYSVRQKIYGSVIFATIIISVIVIIGKTIGLPKAAVSIERYDYFISQFIILLKYFKLFIIPIGQSIDHDLNLIYSVFSVKFLISIMVHLCILFLAIYAYRKGYKEVIFGYFWYLGTISLESSIIPIKDPMVEHRNYLPFLGLLLMISPILTSILKKKNAKYGLVAYFIILSILTYKRNVLWGKSFLIWQDAMVKTPNMIRPIYNYAEALDKYDSLDLALKFYKKSIEVDSLFPSSYNNIGNIYLRKDSIELAKQYFEKAIELNPKFGDALNNMGVVLKKQDLIEDALYYFKQAYKYSGVNKISVLNIADIYLHFHRLEEAKKFLEPLAEYYHKDTDVLLRLGRIYLEDGQNEKAFKSLQFVSKSKPKMILVNYYLGLYYFAKKDFKMAKKYFLLEKERTTSDVNLYLKLGNCYFFENKYTEALKEYNSVVKIDSSNFDAYYNIGVIKQKQNHLDDALKFYDLAEKINPGNIELKQNKAIVLLYNDKFKTAEKYFKELLETGNNLDDNYYYLGLLYYNLHNKELAKKYFKKALSVNSSHVQSRLSLEKIGIM